MRTKFSRIVPAALSRICVRGLTSSAHGCVRSLEVGYCCVSEHSTQSLLPLLASPLDRSRGRMPPQLFRLVTPMVLMGSTCWVPTTSLRPRARCEYLSEESLAPLFLRPIQNILRLDRVDCVSLLSTDIRHYIQIVFRQPPPSGAVGAIGCRPFRHYGRVGVVYVWNDILYYEASPVLTSSRLLRKPQPYARDKAFEENTCRLFFLFDCTIYS